MYVNACRIIIGSKACHILQSYQRCVWWTIFLGDLPPMSIDSYNNFQCQRLILEAVVIQVYDRKCVTLTFLWNMAEIRYNVQTMLIVVLKSNMPNKDFGKQRPASNFLKENRQLSLSVSQKLVCTMQWKQPSKYSIIPADSSTLPYFPAH